MAELKTDDYKGKDRRNGGKIRLTPGDTIKLILIAGSVIGAVTGWYFQTNYTVNSIAEANEAMALTVRVCGNENIKQDQAIGALTKDIQYIKKGQESMHQDMKDRFTLLLQEIRRP